MTKTEAVGLLEQWLDKLEHGQSIFVSHYDKSFARALKIVLLETDANISKGERLLIKGVKGYGEIYPGITFD